GSIKYRVLLNGETIAENMTSQSYVLTNLDKGTRYTIEVIESTSNASREDSISFETIGADDQNNDQNNDKNNNAGSTVNWNA
ncbi:chitinase, partial [Francisella tularensis subsp. holarctica]|nr:chitinase [Francisella tularensis subsp. holarctica]